ncbi:patatin-like phospholipase family protein [Cohnella sp. AR92]|uniref:patatin-like phospholipase family protein n=1 Tax=Cohnella sp. AR92 TaxID=648716 RepID=UPI000F8F751C|nr:patatin-like phospholipase family protein [Cohnella sp. AR92]RUS48047.1 patatin [Cohnella sp. AR92]
MKVNGVFEGGGVKGISLVGAVRAAERNDVQFNKVAGTSSGSIVAALLATGYTASEMKFIIESTPFARFMRRAPLFNLKFIGPAIRLFLKKGLYSGEALETWVRNLLAAKGVRTFADLPLGKLRITASDITNGRLLVLPDDIVDYGIDPLSLEVAKAVRMSVSIPYFFDPVLIPMPFPTSRGRRHRKLAEAIRSSYIVDGGVLSNFPLWIFDSDQEGQEEPVPVIGFQMVGRNDMKAHRIVGPITMFQAMFETMLSAHDERYIEQNNRVRTIKIPTLGVRTTDFNLTNEKSESLYQSGMEAGEKFFRNWDRKTGRLMNGSDGPSVTIQSNRKE